LRFISTKLIANFRNIDSIPGATRRILLINHLSEIKDIYIYIYIYTHMRARSSLSLFRQAKSQLIVRNYRFRLPGISDGTR